MIDSHFKAVTHHVFQAQFTGLLLVVSFLFMLPSSATAEITVKMYDRDQEIDVMTIGKDLWLQISDASPYESFNVTLKDEFDTVIKCGEIKTNGLGYSKLQMFWDSGVKGQGANVSPGPYRFPTYLAAENALDDKELTLEVESLDVCGPPDDITLPMETDSTEARPYVADYTSLPIFERGTSDLLYLGIDHLPNDWQEIRVFVIDKDDPTDPTTGGWLDVRPGFQLGQAISLATAGSTNGPDLLELIWAAPDGRDVELVIRVSTSGPTSPSPVPLPGDSTYDVPEMSGCPYCLPEDPDECLECVD